MPCATAAEGGKTVFGIFGVCFFSASFVYFIIEFASLETLDLPSDAPENTNLALLWTDFAACAVGFSGALVVLMPDFCCGEGSKERTVFRRERFFAALLFLIATLLVSMTSRVRDNNINQEGHNENFVCSRRDALDACPSSRVKLSEAFRLWSRANDPEDECWYNTSSSFPEAFTWGEEFEFSEAYATADFNDAETYEQYPDYAPCFWWGCGSCLPSQRAMHERLLRYEVLVQVGSLVATALSLCLQSVYHEQRIVVARAYKV